MCAVGVAFRGHLGAIWGPSGGHCGVLLGQLRAILEQSFVCLPSQGHLEAILGSLGVMSGPFEPSVCHLGAF